MIKEMGIVCLPNHCNGMTDGFVLPAAMAFYHNDTLTFRFNESVVNVRFSLSDRDSNKIKNLLEKEPLPPYSSCLVRFSIPLQTLQSEPLPLPIDDDQVPRRLSTSVLVTAITGFMVALVVTIALAWLRWHGLPTYLDRAIPFLIK